MGIAQVIMVDMEDTINGTILLKTRSMTHTIGIHTIAG